MASTVVDFGYGLRISQQKGGLTSRFGENEDAGSSSALKACRP
jgi:hypothetical protein